MEKDFDRWNRKKKELDIRISASNNNFRNPLGNLFKNLWREITKLASDKSLVNGYNFANKHNTFSQQTGTFLLGTFDRIVSSLGCGIDLRSNSDQNDIFMRTIECVRRNNKSWALFERAEVSEWKGNENNITALIADHILNPVHYSRIQMMDLQTSGVRVYQNQLILAVAQAIVSDLQALISLLRVQFVLRTNFAYTNSVSHSITKTTDP